MRLVVALMLLLCATAMAADEAAPPAGLDVVYAVSTLGKAPVTAIYAAEATGLRRLLYRDSSDANQVILKIAGSDVLGAGRAAPPKDVHVVMGPAVAPVNPSYTDAICRLRFPEEPGKQAAPEKVLSLALSFSEQSPYLLWNRAPIFAVSADGSKFAVYALRVGEEALERPTIRVIPTAGEEWQIPLPSQSLYVADLAFSPDGKLLAYSVLPQGDEHTLDTAQLPIAGLYLADAAARTARLVFPGYIDAVAWGPRPEQVTVAARMGDFWSTKYAAFVINVPSGRKVREFSLRGAVSALAYSDDARWLAAQTLNQTQQVWVYPVSGGWGRPFPLPTETGGRIALLGWARLAPLTGPGDPDVK